MPIKDQPIKWTKWAESMNYTDENLLDFLNRCDKGKEKIENIDKAVESVGKTTSFASKTISGLKKVGSVLASMGTTFGAMWIISAAFKALDDYTHQYSRSLEEASKASGEYETQKNHVQQLTSEYDTLQSKIKQLKSLQANGTITMAQEVELSNLQNQSVELERQLDIQKQLLDIKSKTSADAAKKASEEEMSFVEMNQQKYGKIQGYWEAFKGLFDTKVNDDKLSKYDEWKESDTTQSGLVKKYLSELSDYESELASVQEKLRKDANNPELLKNEKDLNEKILDTKQQLSSGIDTIQKWIDQSLDENGLPIKGSERFVDSLRDVITEYQNFGKSTKEIDLNNLNNYFSSTAGSPMKKYLEDIVKNGGSAKDALKAFRESGMRLKDIDVSESGFLRYFNDIKKSAKEAEEAINSVDGTFSGVNEAFESENQGASYDKMLEYFKTSKELNKKGLWGTDDFQTIAQFGVGYDIGKKLKENADAYTYASDAYVEAYNKALPLLERWYGNEDELVNMNNALADFTNKGLARNLGNNEYTFLDENQKPLFENTAQAAQKLETSVENVELIMSKLEEHGFEFDGIEHSADQLNRYKSSLEGLHTLVEDMKDGSQKDRVMKLLPGWDEELEKFKDPNYLATLTEDQILKIEFEYDLAQLQQQLNEAMELAQATGDNQDWAAARLAAKNVREHYESQTGYDENSEDAGYTNSYNKIDELSSSMKGKSEEIRAEINEQIASLMQLQNAFQDFRLSGGQLNWNEFINSEGASEALNNILETTNLTKEQLADLLNVDVEDLHFDVDADTSKAEEKLKTVNAFEFSQKVAELTMNDNATPYLQLWNELQANDKFTSLNAIDQASYVVELWNALTPEQKEAYLNGEITVVDQATGTVQTVEGALESLPLSPQAIISATNNTGTAVLNARTALNSIDGKTVNTYIVTHKKTIGDAGLIGTAHANGTVGGLYPIPKLSHRALALGSLQDTSWLKPTWKTRSSEVALTGELGTEIVVHGNRWWTVGDNGAEFASIPKGSVIFNHKQSKELLSKGFTNSRAKSYAHGTAFATGGRLPSSGSSGGSSGGSNSSGSSSSNSSNSSSKSDADKEFKEKIDEIEILLDRMEKSLKRLTNSIESYSHDLSKQSEVSSQAMNQIRNNLSTLQQAYNRYMQEANSVGLDASWVSKIQNGSINIETITDKDLKDKIDEYKKWYEKSIDIQDKIADTQKELLDLAVEKLDNIEKYFDNRIDFNDNFGYLTPITLLQESLDKFKAELEKQVNDGVIIKGSNEWYDAMESIANLQDRIFEASIKKYQDIIDNLSRISDTLDNSLELKEARDEPIHESDYRKQIDLNNKVIQEKYNKRNQLLKKQASFDVGSKEYDEFAKDIADIDDDIYGLLIDIEELKNKIWEVRWQPFFDGQEALKDLVSETESFRDLLDSDIFIGKNGGLTDEGLANLALISQSMNASKQSIKNYQAALEKLQEDYDKGNISAKEFNETSKEFMDGIASGVSSVEKYKDEIVSLYEEMLRKENDVVQSSIDKQKELLSIRKENDNYSRNVKKQTKDINSLQAQISALSGVNNQNAKAELKRLQAQLAEAKDELSQTQKDREYDIRQKGYEGLSSDLTNAMNDTLDEVKYNSSKQEEVISSMLNNVVNNYKDAYGKINQIIANTGFKPSNGFQENIDNLGSQSGASNQIQNSNTIAPNYKPDNFVGNINTGQIQSGSAQSNNDRIESDISKEPNTSNRPIAQIIIEATSLTIQEGENKNVSVIIKPSDAANKTLKWETSNSAIATVSNGSIHALKPGSCQITAIATDGGGATASVGVVVTAKPKPKPPAPKPSGGGDGKPWVGDKVTFRGMYYSDSWGANPIGNLYSGVPGGVVIDGYSGSEYGGQSRMHGGYAIHIKSADGKYGNLGWVSLSQISGYAKGTRGITNNLELAKINELGNELVIRRGGNDYTTLTYGSAVVPHDLSNKLFTLAEHTNQILNSTVGGNGVGGNVEVNNHYDSMLTVNGNVDRDALPGLEKLLEKSYEYTSKRMYKDAGLMGIQRKL